MWLVWGPVIIMEKLPPSSWDITGTSNYEEACWCTVNAEHPFILYIIPQHTYCSTNTTIRLNWFCSYCNDGLPTDTGLKLNGQSRQTCHDIQAGGTYTAYRIHSILNMNYLCLIKSCFYCIFLTGAWCFAKKTKQKSLYNSICGSSDGFAMCSSTMF